MKPPPPEQAERFIKALCEYGWEVRGELIYSEEGHLHFPYPSGWFAGLDDLEEIMTRRHTRFQDRSRYEYMEEEDWLQMVRAHAQALEAIAEARVT